MGPFVAPLLALGLTGAAARAAEEVGPKAPLRLEFPEIKGFKRHSEDTALAGDVDIYSYDAVDRHVTVTIYVYDRGRATVPSGPGSAVVRGEMDTAEGGIRDFGKAGRYRDVKRISDGEVPLGDGKAPRFLRRVFEYEADGRAVVSQLWLTGHQDHFIKVRCTYSAAARDESEKDFRRVLAELEKMLSRP